MLEEESIFWVDDLDLASSMVIKTIKYYSRKRMTKLSMHAVLARDDDDDKEFMVGLVALRHFAQGVT